MLDFHTVTCGFTRKGNRSLPPHVVVYDVDSEKVVVVFPVSLAGSVDAAELEAIAFVDGRTG
jgi:hypothetical protein